MAQSSETCTPMQQVYGTAKECLPNTGADVWPKVLLGLGLLLVGILLWKLTTRFFG